MSDIVDQFKVESESNPDRKYVVSQHADGSFSCGCLGWTRHVPRQDCKHIRWVRMGGEVACDPMLRAVEKAQAKAARKERSL